MPDLPSEGPVRDRLFDLLMRRIDALQAQRAGVLALLRALPADPATALLLTLATRRSMRWMLEAVGIPTRGVRGELRVKGMVGAWLWTIRAWRTDESEDLPVDDGGARYGAAPRRAGGGMAGLAPQRNAADVAGRHATGRREPIEPTPDPAA